MEKEEIGRKLLGVTRISIGILFLWPFFDKLLGLGFQTPSGMGMIDGTSPSSMVVYTSGGLLADFFNSIGGSAIVDFFLMAGLLCIGITLTMGIASKITTAASIPFLIFMYLVHVPPVDNPLIDHRIVMLVAILAIYYLDGFAELGFEGRWRDTALVKKCGILE